MQNFQMFFIFTKSSLVENFLNIIKNSEAFFENNSKILGNDRFCKFFEHHQRSIKKFER